ncbi:MAG: 4-(cytidine 5'-diphospho)-2-C-methyl-D-erythritol kinase [Bacteroidota bacterium]
MIVFPNAKINIGLHVTEKRPDGFHNIETIFFPVPDKPGESDRFCDVLEVLPARKKKNDSLQVTGTSEKIDIQDNLVMKALQLLRERYSIPPVNIHLHKKIPSGAGLGGGSSDAAFMLRSINDLFKLNISSGDLETMASQLGADCAFFIRNNPTLAKGKGNEFSPVSLDLKGYWLAIVVPSFHIGTAEAYRNIHPRIPERNILDTIQQKPEKWPTHLINDFEANAIAMKCPEIKLIKETLYEKGAAYASMSGSGSAVYGIFRQQPEMAWPNSYTYWCGPVE